MLTELSVAVTGIKPAPRAFILCDKTPRWWTTSLEMQRCLENTPRSWLTAVRWRRLEPFIRSETPELSKADPEKLRLTVSGKLEPERTQSPANELGCLKQIVSCFPEGFYQEKTNRAFVNGCRLHQSKIILSFGGSRLCCRSSKRALGFLASLHMCYLIHHETR